MGDRSSREGSDIGQDGDDVKCRLVLGQWGSKPKLGVFNVSSFHARICARQPPSILAASNTNNDKGEPEKARMTLTKVVVVNRLLS